MRETPFRFHRNQLPTNFNFRPRTKNIFDGAAALLRNHPPFSFLFSRVSFLRNDLLKKKRGFYDGVGLPRSPPSVGRYESSTARNRRLDRASCHDSGEYGVNRAVILINERPSFLAAEMIWYFFFSSLAGELNYRFDSNRRPTIITNSNMECASRERSVFWIRAINVEKELFFLSLILRSFNFYG